MIRSIPLPLSAQSGPVTSYHVKTKSFVFHSYRLGFLNISKTEEKTMGSKFMKINK